MLDADVEIASHIKYISIILLKKKHTHIYILVLLWGIYFIKFLHQFKKAETSEPFSMSVPKPKLLASMPGSK